MKKVKILTITLVIALVTMIAFFGIYTHVQNRMEDQVKGYEYAMDLKGTRTIRLKASTENKTTVKDSEGKEVSDASNLTDDEISEKGYTKEETPYNDESVLTADNYKKSKEIIEKRLEQLNIDNYTIKLDEQTGDIVLEVPENDGTDNIVSNINTVGKFEIIDSETNEVLMDNNDIKLANVMYGSDSSSTGVSSSNGTIVYLNIEYTKDGSKKLEDISTTYTNTTSENTTTSDENTTSEESTESTESTEKKVTMKIDDEEIMSTSFDEALKTGKMQLSIGQASTDSSTVQGYVDQAATMATILDTGNLPVKYDVDENRYVLSDITNDELQIVAYIMAGVAALALVVLVIRYKSLGLIGTISYIGLASIFALLIRYTNVILSIEGIFAIALVLILNYIFINKLVSKAKGKNKEEISNVTKETYKNFFIKIIPICITVITFCFVKWAPMSSFGMVMFWGIALIAIYNFIITNSLLKIKAEK